MLKNKILILSLLLLFITGCSVPNPEIVDTKKEIDNFQKEYNQIIDDKDIDVDLTKLSSTMIYGEVFNMISNPKKYEGKIIKIQGSYNQYQDEDRLYHHVIIEDAAACCEQGLEIALKSEFTYPPLNTEISVVGEFEIYDEISEYGVYYYRLKDAVYSE